MLYYTYLSNPTRTCQTECCAEGKCLGCVEWCPCVSWCCCCRCRQYPQLAHTVQSVLTYSSMRSTLLSKYHIHTTICTWWCTLRTFKQYSTVQGVLVEWHSIALRLLLSYKPFDEVKRIAHKIYFKVHGRHLSHWIIYHNGQIFKFFFGETYKWLWLKKWPIMATGYIHTCTTFLVKYRAKVFKHRFLVFRHYHQKVIMQVHVHVEVALPYFMWSGPRRG